MRPFKDGVPTIRMKQKVAVFNTATLLFYEE